MINKDVFTEDDFDDYVYFVTNILYLSDSELTKALLAFPSVHIDFLLYKLRIDIKKSNTKSTK